MNVCKQRVRFDTKKVKCPYFVSQTVRQLLVVGTRDKGVALPSTNLHVYLRLRVAESLGSLWRLLNEKPTHLEGTERPRKWPGNRHTNTCLNLLIT